MKRTISKSERPYKLLLCVMISLLVIMLAGCSTSSDSDTNTRGFTDFATIEEEYLTTIESLNWPEGVTLPDALEGEDTGASFQIGYGDTRHLTFGNILGCRNGLILTIRIRKGRQKP